MKLPEWIEHIKESREPLSCHIFIINGKDNTWIYDSGANEFAFNRINSIKGNKNIVISHFHADHLTNAIRLNNATIYQGDYTFKHTNTGVIINDETLIKDGMDFKLLPLPNTHAKGSIMLEVNEYAFLGDAIYPTHKNGHHCYNATLLKKEIDVLKASNANFFILSHNDEFIYTKDDIINRLERVYSKRNPQEAFINLD